MQKNIPKFNSKYCKIITKCLLKIYSFILVIYFLLLSIHLIYWSNQYSSPLFKFFLRFTARMHTCIVCSRSIRFFRMNYLRNLEKKILFSYLVKIPLNFPRDWELVHCRQPRTRHYFSSILPSLRDAHYRRTLAWITRLKASSIDCVLQRGNLEKRARKRDPSLAKEENDERGESVSHRRLPPLSRLREFNAGFFSEMWHSRVYLDRSSTPGDPLLELAKDRDLLFGNGNKTREKFREKLTIGELPEKAIGNKHTNVVCYLFQQQNVEISIQFPFW